MQLRAAEVRDHARVRVNGQPAAKLPWAQWGADMEFINTNANFVAQEAPASGLLGRVT
ncbi:MAG: hypothetical protein M3463_09500 [Verrucomicrobiota bacterium]|nr:hypothetical protein [Verrucomicrobiota bacterium]